MKIFVTGATGFLEGRVGESYILAGPALTYPEAMQMWQQITGVPAPKWWFPDWFVRGVAGIARVPEYYGLKLPIGSETLSTLANYTFYGDSAKAARELGWKQRPIKEVFEDALDLARRKKN